MSDSILLAAIILIFGTAANSQIAQQAKGPEFENRTYTKVVYDAPVQRLLTNRLSQSFWKIEAESGGVVPPDIASYTITPMVGFGMNSDDGVITAPTQCDCIISMIQISPFEVVIEFVELKSFVGKRLNRNLGDEYLFPLLDDLHQSEFTYETFSRFLDRNGDGFHVVKTPRELSPYNYQNFEDLHEDHVGFSHGEEVCEILDTYVNNQDHSLKATNAIWAQSGLEKGSESNFLKILFRDLFLNGMFAEAEHILDSFDLGETDEAALRPILDLASDQKIDKQESGKLTCNSFHSLLLTMSSAPYGHTNDDRTKLKIVKSFNELSFGLRLSLSQQLSSLLVEKLEMTPSFASAIAETDSTISSLTLAQDSSVDIDGLAAMSVTVRETEWGCDTSSTLLEGFLSKRRYFDALRHIMLDTCQDEENEANGQELLLNSLKQNVDTLTLLEISDNLLDTYPSLSADIISLIDERGFPNKALALKNRYELVGEISNADLFNAKSLSASINSQIVDFRDNLPGLRFDLEDMEIEAYTPSNELSLDRNVSNQLQSKISVQDAQNWILTSQKTRFNVLDSFARP